MVALCAQAANGSGDRDHLLERMREMSSSFTLNAETMREIMVRGWEKAIDEILATDLISTDDYESLVEYCFDFGLTHAEQDRRRYLTRLERALFLRNLLDGKAKRWIEQASQQFNLRDHETLVFVFDYAVYFLQRFGAERAGDLAQYRFQDGLGHYIGAAAFADTPVDREQAEAAESGVLGITTKNLYFAGTKSEVTIPLGNAMTLWPFLDGLGVVRGLVTAAPQIFVTGDGWFTYNLVSNLREMGDQIEFE
jgi:hypothetical protein